MIRTLSPRSRAALAAVGLLGGVACSADRLAAASSAPGVAYSP